MSMIEPTKHCNGYHDEISDIAFEHDAGTHVMVPERFVQWKAEKPVSRPTPPARCSIKWRDDDIEFLYTVEANSNAECFTMMKEVKTAIAKSRQATPSPSQPSSSPQPANPPVQGAVAPTDVAPDGYCTAHGVWMKQYTKDSGASSWSIDRRTS